VPEATEAPPSTRSRDAALAAAAVLLAATGFYLRLGYSFGVEDHDDLLPELLRRIDPALFTRDPFVADRMAGVSPRDGFVSLLHVLSSGLSVPAAVGLVHAVTIAAVAFGIWRLARALLPSLPMAALLAPVVVMVPLLLWPLGQNTIAYSYLVPEGIAWALVLPALAGMAGGRVALPAVLVGLAGWVHAVTALIVALALALVIAAEPGGRRSALVRAAGFGALFALVAAPFVVPLLAGQAGEQAGLGPSGYDVFVRLRLPHHLLPTAYPMSSWARFSVLAMAGGAAIAWLRRRGRLDGDGFAGRFLAVTAALCAVAFVGVVLLESLGAARAQAFKLTVPAAAVLGVALCGAAALAMQEAPASFRKILELPLRAPFGTLGVTALLGGATLAAAVAGAGRPGALYGPRAHAASDAGRVEAWAARETDVGALFVVPPPNSSFRVGARRSVFVTWKAHPFRADGIRRWLEDLQMVAPVPVPASSGWRHRALADSAYCANDTAQWQSIAEWTEADYALVEAGCGAPPSAPVYRVGGLSVYPL
jgi:hypothetical protein